jgi:hypothetical protein
MLQDTPSAAALNQAPAAASLIRTLHPSRHDQETMHQHIKDIASPNNVALQAPMVAQAKRGLLTSTHSTHTQAGPMTPIREGFDPVCQWSISMPEVQTQYASPQVLLPLHPAAVQVGQCLPGAA